MKIPQITLLQAAHAAALFASLVLALSLVRLIDRPEARLGNRPSFYPSEVKRTALTKNSQRTKPRAPARFVVDRNPFAATSVNTPVTTEVPSTRPPATVPHLMFFGTVDITGGRRSAVIQAQGGKTQLLKVGQPIEGFRIKKIGKGVVTLSSPDTTVTLRIAPR